MRKALIALLLSTSIFALGPLPTDRAEATPNYVQAHADAFSPNRAVVWFETDQTETVTVRLGGAIATPGAYAAITYLPPGGLELSFRQPVATVWTYGPDGFEPHISAEVTAFTGWPVVVEFEHIALSAPCSLGGWPANMVHVGNLGGYQSAPIRCSTAG